MKKYLVVAGLFVGLAFLLSKDVKADGVYRPDLVTSTNTLQNFLYQYPVPATGGVMVSNGSVFNWSNSTIASTSTSTSQQFPALTRLTVAQIQGASGIIPASAGQLVMCTDCVNNPLCISTGSANAFQWVGVSSTTIQTCR